MRPRTASSSGWEDRSWSTYVSVPSQAGMQLSAIRVRLTAYMYACMTRMRYVTGHSCSLEIIFGVFLNPHRRWRSHLHMYSHSLGAHGWHLMVQPIKRCSVITYVACSILSKQHPKPYRAGRGSTAAYLLLHRPEAAHLEHRQHEMKFLAPD